MGARAPSPLLPPACTQVTIVSSVEKYGGPKHVPGGHTPHPEWPKFKYLLNIEGSGSSHR